MNIAFSQASQGNGIEILEYLLDRGFSYDPKLSIQSAIRGQIEIIKILHKKGYEIHRDTHSYNKVVDEYLHENRLGIYQVCDITCKRCHVARMNNIIEMWYLEAERYDYLHQWLPRELVEDLIVLSDNEHYYQTEYKVEF